MFIYHFTITFYGSNPYSPLEIHPSYFWPRLIWVRICTCDTGLTCRRDLQRDEAQALHAFRPAHLLRVPGARRAADIPDRLCQSLRAPQHPETGNS